MTPAGYLELLREVQQLSAKLTAFQADSQFLRENAALSAACAGYQKEAWALRTWKEEVLTLLPFLISMTLTADLLGVKIVEGESIESILDKLLALKESGSEKEK